MTSPSENSTTTQPTPKIRALPLSSIIAKKLLLFLVVILACLVSLTVVQYIAQEFFFDRLIYKKSPIYGYYPPNNEGLLQEDHFLIQYRTKDLTKFTSGSLNPSVMGATDSLDYTIAILGDSFAFGVGVKANQTFPTLLEAKLNKLRPTTVLNLSLGGDSILDHYAKYQLVKQQVDPDLLVVTIVDNDLIIDDPGRYPGEMELYHQLQTMCPGTEFKFDWDQDPHLSTENMITRALFPSISDKYTNLCYFGSILNHLPPQNTLFFSLMPTPDTTANLDLTDLQYLAGQHAEMVRYTLRQLARDYHFSTLSFSNYESYNWVSKRDGHPSSETHHYYAELLYQEITSNPKWGFSK